MKCRSTIIAATLLAALAVLPAPAVPPDEQMQFADGLYLRGLHDLAVKEYMVILRDAQGFPKMDQVLYRIAECYRESGNSAAADLFYKRVIREFVASPFRFKAELRRAELFVTATQYADATTLLTALIAAQPPAEIASGAHYYLGYAMARSGRTAEGQAEFQRILKEFASTPYAALAALELAAQRRAAGAKPDELAAMYRQAAEHASTPAVAAEAWFQLGDLAYGAKNYGEAATAYGKLLKDHASSPRAAEARLQTAWSFYHTKRFAEALPLAEEALKAGPAEALLGDWFYLKANCQRQLMDDEGATATYDRLAQTCPTNRLASAAVYEAALIAFKQRKYEDTVRRLSSFQAEPAVRQDFNWLLAESYAGSGQTNLAVQHYRMIVDGPAGDERVPDAMYRLGRLLQARGDRSEASTLYRLLADRHPKHEAAAPSLLASGFCLAADGHFAEAVGDWGRIARDHPQSPVVEEALFQKGLAELRLERDAQARESLTDLLKRYPKTSYAAEARYWIAAVLERKQEFGLAEQELREALKLDATPELKRRIQYRLAGMLQKQQKTDEAADLLQSLLQTPTRQEMTPALLEWLARMRLEKGRHAAAAEAATTLLAMTSDEAWLQIGYYLLGRARQGEGNRPAAIDAYRKAAGGTKATRESIQAVLVLGNLLLEEQQPADAQKYFLLAAERAADPSLLEVRAQALHGLGRVAETQQDWEQAARYFLSVAILFDHPQLSPECLYRASEAFRQLGQTEKRAQFLKELAERYPNSDWAKRAQAQGVAPSAPTAPVTATTNSTTTATNAPAAPR